uniref:Uncharacterized protein n=1 Tax=Nelumbo nucifera TaxID=4432 RepID=A0A822Z930_NELNU|nr:TPA_asm: hypothetical protein HUJ06_014192 [Nelumbo nucifera]
MFGFRCKRLIIQLRSNGELLKYLQNPFSKSISNISNSANDSSFTVSYLVNTCGFSPETALSLAEKVHLEDGKKPDSVLKLFEKHGFTKTQIAELISKRPSLLLADPVKTLEPKIRSLSQVGLSGPDVARILSSSAVYIFSRSLEKQILPMLDFLKTLLRTEKNIAVVINRFTWIFQYNVLEALKPKISILRDYGVPESNISKMFMLLPRIITLSSDRFKELVKEISEMGFDPSSTMFIKAVNVKAGMNKAKWESKFDVYRSFGWSDGDILLMFKRNPYCFAISEKNIRSKLDYFMNKLNLDPAVLSRNVPLFGLSLENRVIPRLSVIQVLLSKGLIKEDLSIATVLILPDVKFLEKFVMKYLDEASDLLKVYRGMEKVLTQFI